MSVSADHVRHIAALARLGVNEAGISTLAAELNSILGHMEVLGTADTTGVPADDAEARGAMPLREDGGAPVPLQRGREEFAPEMRHGFFLVPRLATHEESEE